MATGGDVATESAADVTSLDLGETRYSVGECVGMNPVDLVCGTRLRVDAIVDEHALRRALSPVKVS